MNGPGEVPAQASISRETGKLCPNSKLTIGSGTGAKRPWQKWPGRCCDSRSIRDGDVLVGTSLGGMAACEITKIRKIPVLCLVASAVTKEEVSSLLAALQPLIHVTPIEWLKFSAGSIPLELAQMFLGVEASFIRSMCSAVFEWDGLGVTATRVFRIHGKRDHVIPLPKNVDLVLDGGHLLTMTHRMSARSLPGLTSVALGAFDVEEMP